MRRLQVTAVRLFNVAVLASLLAACGNLPPRCAPGEEPAVSEWLYFGTQRPGGWVSPREWREFLRTAVTPRFPQGLTTWRANGQWQQGDGQVVRERSHVLNLVHAGGAEDEARVRALMAEYKLRFEQEAVLRVRSAVCVSL